MHDEREETVPFKGFLRVHERPSCLSCTRLKGLADEADSDEGGKDPYCAFAGGMPSSAKCTGTESCEGYDPRPAWDFAIPVEKSRSSSGAILIAPGGKGSTHKPKPRDVVVLIAPERNAVLVPPPTSRVSRRDDAILVDPRTLADPASNARRLNAQET